MSDETASYIIVYAKIALEAYTFRRSSQFKIDRGTSDAQARASVLIRGNAI